ncbi:cytochrome P450 9c1 [Drosophila sulfurigaster albostrigata]|uniref:cytochrome P450 9c1 n=1 Tax=Drosophila sulfurigaster albostrigata TaxID=89887 RepID=UPI002D218984|nr:cytochrome P450 9c1 [Drosophila sulfurigaster albostrigata]
MALVELFLLLAIIGVLLYKWTVSSFGFFRGRGVAHLPPKPLLGNTPLSVLMGSGSYLKHSLELHQQLKQNKIYGIYNLSEPLYYLADPELIRQVGIKHFDNFTNHRKGITDENATGNDSVISKSLLSLRDRRWKHMRQTLTPAFTGVKIRLMFELINACNVEAVSYVERQLKQENNEGVELELKEFFTRYTNDVIATAAFGIKVNSFVDQQNEFFTLGQRVLQFSFWGGLKVMLYILLPRLMKALRVQVMDMNNVAYFKRLVFGAMKERKERNIVRPDMIQQLMEAQRLFKEQEARPEGIQADAAEFNDEDVLAQCLLFFSAGFETVSTCLCFTTYELLMNPEVQQKLYEEIEEVQQKLDGKPLDYDSLMGMKYLDCVISESLRKWPPAIVVDRMCGADFELRDEQDELLVKLRKDELVHIPIVALHHDPDNFEEPEEFRPERFDDEHKHEIRPFTYLPFGIGQRSCIGNRMALMEVKSLIYQLVLRFQLLPGERTTQDMLSSIVGFRLEPRELFWCRFEPRKAADSQTN